MEAKEFPVPPVDEIFTPSFGLHLYHKPLGGGKTTSAIYFSPFYKVLFHLRSSQ